MALETLEWYKSMDVPSEVNANLKIKLLTFPLPSWTNHSNNQSSQQMIWLIELDTSKQSLYSAHALLIRAIRLGKSEIGTIRFGFYV